MIETISVCKHFGAQIQAPTLGYWRLKTTPFVCDAGSFRSVVEVCLPMSGSDTPPCDTQQEQEAEDSSQGWLESASAYSVRNQRRYLWSSSRDSWRWEYSCLSASAQPLPCEISKRLRCYSCRFWGQGQQGPHTGPVIEIYAHTRQGHKDTGWFPW